MYRISILFLTLLVFAACGDHRPEVDLDKVRLEPVVVQRLDRDLFTLTPGNIGERTPGLKKKYGILYEHYLMNPLRLHGSADTSYSKEVLKFVNDRDVRQAFEAIQRAYPDLNQIEESLNDMRKRFSAYFPQRKVPARLVSLISGWNYAVAYMDSALWLGLDMYLGDTAQFYQMLRYPLYQVRKMNRHHILPDLARGWILTEFDTVKPRNTLLNHTVFYGKIYYAVKALLPEVDDSLIIGYSAEQMKTCRKYEKQYWSYLAGKNRLYENSLTNIRELTSDGPFTGAISRDCPPRIAMWIGWRIVQSYMDRNREVTLEQLMLETDAQKVLSKSKYRP